MGFENRIEFLGNVLSQKAIEFRAHYTRTMYVEQTGPTKGLGKCNLVWRHDLDPLPLLVVWQKERGIDPLQLTESSFHLQRISRP